MLKHLLQFGSGLDGRFFFGINGIISETLPNVAHRLIGRMHHVFLIETVIAQLVQEDFVGGEIMGIAELSTNFIDSEQ